MEVKLLAFGALHGSVFRGGVACLRFNDFVALRRPYLAQRRVRAAQVVAWPPWRRARQVAAGHSHRDNQTQR